MRHRCVAAAWIAASFWAALVQAPASASAQAYPDRSVRIVIAFAAGGTIDTLGRIVAQKLSDAWGQSVRVENRPGASGNIGEAAAQSPADGYTLHLGGQVLAVNVTLAPMKGLDPIKDFEPIMWIATAQDVLMVPPDLPFAPRGTPKEIVAKINGDMARILSLPDMKERETTLGYRFIGGSSDQPAAMLRHEITEWAEVAKSASLR